MGHHEGVLNGRVLRASRSARSAQRTVPAPERFRAPTGETRAHGHALVCLWILIHKRGDGGRTRQSNLNAEYFINFCHLWVASMVRMVPDFERITIDCVLAPFPQ